MNSTVAAFRLLGRRITAAGLSKTSFGAICFGCGYLIAFIVVRNQWRDEMIKRGVARYKLADWQMGMGRADKRKVVPANANPGLPKSQRVEFGLAPTGEAGASE